MNPHQSSADNMDFDSFGLPIGEIHHMNRLLEVLQEKSMRRKLVCCIFFFEHYIIAKQGPKMLQIRSATIYRGVL